MRKLEAEEVLKPEVALPAVYLAFLGLSIVSLVLPETRRFLIQPGGPFVDPSIASYAISLLGILVLAASALAAGKWKGHMNSKLVLILIAPLAYLTLHRGLTLPIPVEVIISLGFPLLLLYISRYLEDVSTLTIISLALAVVFVLSILVQGIPIISASSRASTAVDPSRALFHGFAVFSSVLLVAYHKRGRAMAGIAILVALAILSGFKSDAIAILVSAGIAGLLLNKVSLKEVASGLILVGLILTLVSTHIARITHDTWGLPSILYIFYRGGLTFSVFNKIVALSYPLGYLHGGALLDPTQRIISVTILPELYQEPHILTSTLLGPGMLDFGVPGVVFVSLLVGLYLGVMYRLRGGLGTCLYAIALTHAFILVEVGLQLTSILLYLSLLYLTLARQQG